MTYGHAHGKRYSRPKDGQRPFTDVEIRTSTTVINCGANSGCRHFTCARTGSQPAGDAADRVSAQGSGTTANGGIPYLPVQVTRAGTWDNRLDGQNVRMTITAAATTGAVLTVPEAAINAGADARTSVTVVRPGGSSTGYGSSWACRRTARCRSHRSARRG